MERSNFKKRPEYKKSDDDTWHSSGSRSRRRDDDRDSKLIGIEFGVDGNEYLEYTENPQLVDLYREDIGVTAVPFGNFSAVPPTNDAALFGALILGPTPEAAFYLDTPSLSDPIPGYELSSAQGAFEIVDDDELVFGSVLEITPTVLGGNKYTVTSVLEFEGDLKDRDKDGFADSQYVDEITGYVQVTKTPRGTPNPTPEELLRVKFEIDFKKYANILAEDYGSIDPSKIKDIDITIDQTSAGGTDGLLANLQDLIVENMGSVMFPPGLGQLVGVRPL
jgi:hypothetical protein